MNRKKVFYIISSIEKAVAFEWISEMLNSDLIDLEFVLINSRRPRIMSWFENHGIKPYSMAILLIELNVDVRLQENEGKHIGEVWLHYLV